ncbi:GRAM domain-containing protein 2B-like isoform X2 [Dunckerocampus dactyliophorus]|uniref:GRAM domain-containing protein 2B-like isoform X2 n=1 Tax=Dunckerocampus dactyliophorus TaxID=161453 RepID=UPI0024050751|nr:GRAM domain-containing protein 2B-like isoform X2 [Dunckerocampus dactyliophorus]
MSMSRKFSLDSSVCQDTAGLFSTRRGSNKLCKKYRTEGDDGRDFQEVNQNLNGNPTAKERTIMEESADRPDGAISTSSFLKHDKNFHKLFPEVPEGDSLTHTFVCTLQKEVLYYGKLYVSENYVCFHSSVLLKDTKVVIPLSSVQEVKKHNPALSMLSIQTADGEKYFFVSLWNREMCYNLLQRLCSQEQEGSVHSSAQESSAENDTDYNLVSSLPFGKSEDHDQNGSYVDGIFPPPANGDGPVSTSTREEVEDASLWLWRVMEDITFFFLRQSVNFSMVFYIYVILVVLLLLVSTYIGFRIIALEEQLNTLGALTELSLHHRNYQET